MNHTITPLTLLAPTRLDPRQMGERAALEIGYKHLAVDHDNDGFVFDGYMSGFFAGIVIDLK